MSGFLRKEVIGNCTLYLGDCLEILPTLDRAGAVVTDPPYGMAYNSGWQSRRIEGDKDTQARDEVIRLCGDTPMLIFGRWDCPRPDEAKMLLTWNKGDWPGMGDLSLPWGPSTEEIYVIGSGFVGNRRQGSVIHVDRLTGETRHPNEKPVLLMQKLIGWCPEGSILDPFFGVGTTGVACAKMGRSFIGIEIDEGYFDIACERIRAAHAQPDMFVEQP